MTAQETAEFRVVTRLLYWCIGVGLVAAFTFGMWVRGLQSQVEDVPALRVEVGEWKQVMADLVLLQCADTSLNPTEQRICARYEPRMPR